MSLLQRLSRFPTWATADESVVLVNGDCLEVLPLLDDCSLDSVIFDPPYGTTQNEWDSPIDLQRLWIYLDRLARAQAPIVATAAQPFTTTLIMSAAAKFRYAMVWDKVNKYTDFLNATRRPMRRHEDVVVFGSGTTTYNPQMIPVRSYKSRRSQPSRTSSYGKVEGCDYGKEIAEHNPSTVIAIEAHSTLPSNHPTEKPLALMDYLVKTYSNQGDVVLDLSMGSGTTGVSCSRLGRRFVGIDNDSEHFATACRRVAATVCDAPLFDPAPQIIQHGLFDAEAQQ